MEAKGNSILTLQRIIISNPGDVAVAGQTARMIALAAGFDETEIEEIKLAVTELASNLVKHASGGILTLTQIRERERTGIHVESLDNGPGMIDVERAMADGVSTAGGSGTGLGTVNRLMDEFNITSPWSGKSGTKIICKRWHRPSGQPPVESPLDIGAATRPHPGMGDNGDVFIIKKWEKSAIVAVVDGVGHGQFAYRAAQKARQYIEVHFDQPLIEMFRGVALNCTATRGVVMAVARFDWEERKMTFACIGDIEARVIGTPEPMTFVVRRGIVGVNAPNPVVTEHPWDIRGNMMILHSDGLPTHWQWEEFPHLFNKTAEEVAWGLLNSLAKDNDDATVVVVRGALNE